MHRFLAALVLPAAFAACSPQTNDAAMCRDGLMAARAVNVSDLLMTAQSVPACRALALDAMQVVVVETMAKRGLR